MPYIPPSVVQEVKRMDLLTYLKNYEPYELVHFSGNTYTTRTHDSLKISNGKWMWWSQRTGGRSALDYLIKVRGYSFLEAVELLAERANIQPPLFVSENVPMEKQLLLPKKNQDDQKVIAYLLGRGIDKEIIQFCLESGRVWMNFKMMPELDWQYGYGIAWSLMLLTAISTWLYMRKKDWF